MAASASPHLRGVRFPNTVAGMGRPVLRPFDLPKTRPREAAGIPCRVLRGFAIWSCATRVPRRRS